MVRICEPGFDPGMDSWGAAHRAVSSFTFKMVDKWLTGETVGEPNCGTMNKTLLLCAGKADSNTHHRLKDLTDRDDHLDNVQHRLCSQLVTF